MQPLPSARTPHEVLPSLTDILNAIEGVSVFLVLKLLAILHPFGHCGLKRRRILGQGAPEGKAKN